MTSNTDLTQRLQAYANGVTYATVTARLLTEAASTILSLSSQVEELTRDFAALQKAVVGESGLSAITVAGELRARAEAAEARVAALSEALATMNAVSEHQTNYVFGASPGPLTGMRQSVHPLTCGNNSGHTILFPFWDGSKVVLRCADCEYVQDNAGLSSRTALSGTGK